MATPALGTQVLYTLDADTPEQVALVVGVGVVTDDEAGTLDSDVWLTVLPAAAAPYATALPVRYHADGKPNTWRHPADAAPALMELAADAPADDTTATATTARTTKAAAK